MLGNEHFAYQRAILLPLWAHNRSTSNTLKSVRETISGCNNDNEWLGGCDEVNQLILLSTIVIDLIQWYIVYFCWTRKRCTQMQVFTLNISDINKDLILWCCVDAFLKRALNDFRSGVTCNDSTLNANDDTSDENLWKIKR